MSSSTNSSWKTSPILLENQTVLADEAHDFGWKILEEMKITGKQDHELTPLEYYTEFILKKKKLGYLAELFIPRGEALSLALDLKNPQLIKYYVQTKPPLSKELLTKILFAGPEVIEIARPLIVQNARLFQTLSQLPNDRESLELLLNIFEKASSPGAIQHLLHTGSSVTLGKMNLKKIWQREMEKEAAPLEEAGPVYDPPPPDLRIWRREGTVTNPVALKLLLDSETPSWVERNNEMTTF